jgi:hypothetical protein
VPREHRGSRQPQRAGRASGRHLCRVRPARATYSWLVAISPPGSAGPFLSDTLDMAATAVSDALSIGQAAEGMG